jgi:hypothetical protein
VGNPGGVDQGAVQFRLDDGTTLFVAVADLRPIYEALWDRANVPGAISTAALLMDEGHKLARYRDPVELNRPQSDVLRQAVAGLTDLS